MKQQNIKFDGKVIKANGNGNFDVELSNGSIIFCNLKGKIRINNIRINVGDNVTVEMSPYDLTKGTISRRLKK